jgi:AhpD family alkylhydroperoxidase
MGHDPINSTSPSRMNLPAVAPEVFGAMVDFSTQAEAGLPTTLACLVKIRASQLNGCSYCLAMHTEEARAAGESEQRLSSLPEWRRTPLFADSERAALALTEAVTLVATERIPDEALAEAARHFPEAALARLLWTIAAINAWNRVAIATRMVPPGGPSAL